MRRALNAVLRLVARLFFRQIQLAGEENIPPQQGVIFALNHPNGLVDPLLLLAFAPRPVSFLAKAPLFRYPLINIFVKGLDSIPVYRKTDAVAGSNEETFARARELLARGGSVAIFPEGTTHSDPRLKELKTGAARIALGVAASEIAVIPAGIYYTEKQTFRSSVLIIFGAPIGVRPNDSVENLTAGIQRALDAVTLQADSSAVLDLITRAETIFSGGEAGDLAYQLDLRRRFVAGYQYLCDHDPVRIAELRSRIEKFEADLREGGLDLESLMTRRGVVAHAIVAFVLLPFAFAGALLHAVPYLLIELLSRRFARDAEMRATFKIVAAIAFYPLTWIACFWIAPWLPFVAPFLGYVALHVFEELDLLVRSLRARVRDTAPLIAERTAIRAAIAEIAEEMSSRAPSSRLGTTSHDPP